MSFPTSFKAFTIQGGNASGGTIALAADLNSIIAGNPPAVGDTIIAVIQQGNTCYSLGPQGGATGVPTPNQFGNTIGGSKGAETVPQYAGNYLGLYFTIITFTPSSSSNPSRVGLPATFTGFSVNGGNATGGTIQLDVSAAGISSGNAPQVGDTVFFLNKAGTSVLTDHTTVYSLGARGATDGVPSPDQFAATIGGTAGHETLSQWNGNFTNLLIDVIVFTPATTNTSTVASGNFKAFTLGGGQAPAGAGNWLADQANINYGNPPAVGDKVAAIFELGNAYTAYSIGAAAPNQFGSTIVKDPPTGLPAVSQIATNNFSALFFTVITYTPTAAPAGPSPTATPPVPQTDYPIDPAYFVDGQIIYESELRDVLVQRLAKLSDFLQALFEEIFK